MSPGLLFRLPGLTGGISALGEIIECAGFMSPDVSVELAQEYMLPKETIGLKFI